MYALLSFLGLSEEHPQHVGKVILLKWLVQGYSDNSFGEDIHLLLINSSFYMLRNLFFPSPQGSILRNLINLHRLWRVTTTFGSCIRLVIGGRRSTLGDIDPILSPSVDIYLLVSVDTSVSHRNSWSFGLGSLLPEASLP
ncbi:hypothetical protein F2Q69_00061764 [Brassica cretica]|uniref:Uncharacterized protein n=1 Tax=Brassica cretica TaxID=69181 RepID=A0A8S9RIK6_BRACR|nr:hypothetical protein F2Q69_00061764 [Brassica cretica]